MQDVHCFGLKSNPLQVVCRAIIQMAVMPTRLPLPRRRQSALCDLNGVYLTRIGKHLFLKRKIGISAQALIVFAGI
jgi:hypothetical protein